MPATGAGMRSLCMHGTAGSMSACGKQWPSRRCSHFIDMTHRSIADRRSSSPLSTMPCDGPSRPTADGSVTGVYTDRLQCCRRSVGGTLSSGGCAGGACVAAADDAGSASGNGCDARATLATIATSCELPLRLLVRLLVRWPLLWRAESTLGDLRVAVRFCSAASALLAEPEVKQLRRKQSAPPLPPPAKLLLRALRERLPCVPNHRSPFSGRSQNTSCEQSKRRRFRDWHTTKARWAGAGPRWPALHWNLQHQHQHRRHRL